MRGGDSVLMLHSGKTGLSMMPIGREGGEVMIRWIRASGKGAQEVKDFFTFRCICQQCFPGRKAR